MDNKTFCLQLGIPTVPITSYAAAAKYFNKVINERVVPNASKNGETYVVGPEFLDLLYGMIATNEHGVPFPTPDTIRSIAETSWEQFSRHMSTCASKNRVWLSGTCLMPTDTGVKNMSVVFDSTGRLVHKCPKVFLTPKEIDMGIVPGKFSEITILETTEWGRIGFPTCFDNFSKEVMDVYASLDPQRLHVGSFGTSKWDDYESEEFGGDNPRWQPDAWLDVTIRSFRKLPTVKVIFNSFWSGTSPIGTCIPQSAITKSHTRNKKMVQCPYVGMNDMDMPHLFEWCASMREGTQVGYYWNHQD